MDLNNINWKPIIKYGGYVLIALLIVLTVYVIYKTAKKFVGNQITEAQQDYINSLEIDEADLTLPNTQVNNLVAKLKEAFGKYGWGTDEELVYDVFETINSRSDILKLVSAFGVYEDHTLNEWMNKELNVEELAHVQEILSAKGIVYTF